MWKINKEISFSECSLEQIIWYVWRTISKLKNSGQFGYEGNRMEFLGLNIWNSIL
jgi:hypothetical protein